MRRLETERLVLREATPDDAAFILALLNDAGFLANIGDRAVRTLDEAVVYLATAQIFRYGDDDLGFNVVELRSSGKPLGTCGLVKRDALDEPDVGYAFLARASGRGYASEAAAATLRHARTDLGLTSVSAVTSPDNAGSIRVLEKLGMTLKGRVRVTADGPELLHYVSR